MTLALAWIIEPLCMGALSLGCGLALRRAVGHSLPGALLIPAGFACVVAIASLTTMSALTARATVPLLLVVAIAGFALSLGYRPQLDRWALAAVLAVFAVFAAPIVLSGAVTFAGYISLDDTASWLALADNALSHGRSVAGLADSTYSAVLNDYMSTGYPLGSFLALGIGHELTGQDVAWLFQPQIAFLLAAVLAPSLYTLTAPLLQRRALRAAVVFVAAQPAVLFAYAFWSGIKEITVASLVVALAALIAARPFARWRVRDLLPVAVTAAAVVDCLAVTGAIWLGGLVALAAGLVWAHGTRRGVVLAAGLAAMTLVVAAPALAQANLFVAVANAGGSGSITSTSSIANLIAPLSLWQLFGIWPVQDFRIHPGDMTLTYLLIAAAVIAAAYGIAVALRRGSLGLPLLAATASLGFGCVLLAEHLGHSSPWLVAKATAMASPGLLAASAIGAGMMLERGRALAGTVLGRSHATAGAVLALAIAAGVLWSNALAYSDVWLAPSAQFRELQAIGQRFAGDGPALITEYQPYATRHFLRALAPEAPSERRYRPDYLRTGGYLPTAAYADLDAFTLASVLAYRTLILRSSPVESRPPSTYHLVWSKTWYEVWQRPLDPTTRILEHLSLGGPSQPVGVAPCSQIRGLASLAARAGGELIAAERTPAIVVSLAGGTVPPSWGVESDGTLSPTGAGTVSLSVTVRRAGSYGIWIGGSFRDTLSVTVDGLPDGSVTDQINENDQLTPFRSIYLAAGSHQISVSDSGPGFGPGEAGDPADELFFGPLELGRSDTSDMLIDVRPAAAHALCGHAYDWIEAVAPTTRTSHG